MKTIIVHTEPGNATKVNSIATNLKYEEDKIQQGSADAAILVKKDKNGKVVGEYEAVISAGLPKVQEIVGGYKKYGIVTHVVGVDDPAFVAEQAKLKVAADAAALAEQAELKAEEEAEAEHVKRAAAEEAMRVKQKAESK